MTRVIHPNPGGPTHAASPYQRKLQRVRDDVQMLLSVATADDVAEILLIADGLDALIRKNG